MKVAISLDTLFFLKIAHHIVNSLFVPLSLFGLPHQRKTNWLKVYKLVFLQQRYFSHCLWPLSGSDISSVFLISLSVLLIKPSPIKLLTLFRCAEVHIQWNLHYTGGSACKTKHHLSHPLEENVADSRTEDIFIYCCAFHNLEQSKGFSLFPLLLDNIKAQAVKSVLMTVNVFIWGERRLPIRFKSVLGNLRAFAWWFYCQSAACGHFDGTAPA